MSAMPEPTGIPYVPSVWELPGMKSYLVRIDPRDTSPREQFGEQFGPDVAFWDIDAHMGGRTIARLMTIRRELQAWSVAKGEERLKVLNTEVTLNWVLMHPASPWGVGWRCQDGILFNTNPLAGWNMMVIYHGSWFSRDQRGALEPAGVQRAAWWPDADDYRAAIAQVRDRS